MSEMCQNGQNPNTYFGSEKSHFDPSYKKITLIDQKWIQVSIFAKKSKIGPQFDVLEQIYEKKTYFGSEMCQTVSKPRSKKNVFRL